MSVTVLAKRPVFWKDCRPMPLYRETLPPLFHIICCIYLFRDSMPGLDALLLNNLRQLLQVLPKDLLAFAKVQEDLAATLHRCAGSCDHIWPYLTISKAAGASIQTSPMLAHHSRQGGESGTCWILVEPSPLKTLRIIGHKSLVTSVCIILYLLVRMIPGSYAPPNSSEIWNFKHLQTSSNNQIQRVVDQLWPAPERISCCSHSSRPWHDGWPTLGSAHALRVPRCSGSPCPSKEPLWLQALQTSRRFWPWHTWLSNMAGRSASCKWFAILYSTWTWSRYATFHCQI